MKYYGLIVCELDGSIEEVEGEHKYKPLHESLGFSFCNWYKSIEERAAGKEYLEATINKMRLKTTQWTSDKAPKNITL